jgi:hypothetical protein
MHHEIETIAGFGGRYVCHGRLGTDNHLQFGEELSKESSVRLQRGTEGVTPRRQGSIAVRAQMAYETLKCLEQRYVGYVALHLVILAGNEQAALPCQGRVQLLYQGGFANAGMPGDEQQCPPARADAVKGCTQRGTCFFTAIQFLRQVEALKHLMAPQRKGGNTPARLPLPQARGQIALQPARRLIPVCGVLGQEPQHNGRQYQRHGGIDRMWWQRGERQMGMHQFQRIDLREWYVTGEQFVEGHAKRIEVGAFIHGAVHASGLLGC